MNALESDLGLLIRTPDRKCPGSVLEIGLDLFGRLVQDVASRQEDRAALQQSPAPQSGHITSVPGEFGRALALDARKPARGRMSGLRRDPRSLATQPHSGTRAAGRAGDRTSPDTDRSGPSRRGVPSVDAFEELVQPRRCSAAAPCRPEAPLRRNRPSPSPAMRSSATERMRASRSVASPTLSFRRRRTRFGPSRTRSTAWISASRPLR